MPKNKQPKNLNTNKDDDLAFLNQAIAENQKILNDPKFQEEQARKVISEQQKAIQREKARDTFTKNADSMKEEWQAFQQAGSKYHITKASFKAGKNSDGTITPNYPFSTMKTNSLEEKADEQRLKCENKRPKVRG